MLATNIGSALWAERYGNAVCFAGTTNITEQRLKKTQTFLNFLDETLKSLTKTEKTTKKYQNADHRKETQTAVVWSCLLFITSGQNHLERHSERGKKTRQTEEEVGRHHQGLDRPGVRQVQEGGGE